MKQGELYIEGLPEVIKVVEGLLYSGYTVTTQKMGDKVIDDSGFSYTMTTYLVTYSQE